MQTQPAPTQQDLQAAKTILMGKIVTGVSATSRKAIYGLVVNVRLCIDTPPKFARILVDIENGGYVAVSELSEVSDFEEPRSSDGPSWSADDGWNGHMDSAMQQFEDGF